MRIAVDAMGGDYAPEAVVQGAFLAAPQCKADVVLIGDEARIRELIGANGEAPPFDMVHAPEAIGMEESGPIAIRKKKDASLSVAMRLLAEGQVDGVVSAGNSSAIVATAKHYVGLVPGLRRPALAVPIPTPSGDVLLMDAGAHAEADPIHLVQSAVMADAFLKVTTGLPQPRVGLLNIGRESVKGTRIIQKAFALLRHVRIRFIGNVEPQELFTDRVDAVICDGFTGNILLKFFEGISETHLQLFEQYLEEQSAGVREGLWLSFNRFQREHHYQNIGGAPLLGTQGAVVVAHGRSQAPAIANAIHLATLLTENGVYTRMAEELQRDALLAELRHYYGLWVLEHWKSRWGFTPKKT